MLCLSDSIRDDDPSVQRLLCTVEEAHTLPALILAAWSLARVLAIHLVESVLAERARRPTSWPRCPQCGAYVCSKGCVQRQVIEGSARIAIQMAVVETLTADGKDVRLAKSELGKLVEIQSMVEQYRQVVVDALYRDHDTLIIPPAPPTWS